MTRRKRVLYGQAGGVPAGYARVLEGTTLWRGHSPDFGPDFFGPLMGRPGTQRFDQPARNTEQDPGTCYLALSLKGVLVERVVRNVPQAAYSVARMRRKHALATARVTRDLVLIDLVRTVTTVWGLQAAQITAPPVVVPPGAPAGALPYPFTQRQAQLWAAMAHPVPVDGILYGSRFGAGWRCVALWDRARPALVWRPRGRISRGRRLFAACRALGMNLMP